MIVETDGLVKTYNYPVDNHKIEVIVAKTPDKLLRIRVESHRALDYPLIVIEGKNYYEIPVSVIRRGFLRKYSSLPDPDTFKTLDKILSESTDALPIMSLQDALRLMISERWLSTSTRGAEYCYEEKYLNILDKIRALYRKKIALYPRCRMPTLVPYEDLLITGLAGSIGHECLHPYKFKERQRRELDSLLNTITVGGRFDRQSLGSSLEGTNVILSHNCCLGLFSTIPKRINIGYYTDLDAIGFRNEGGAANGVDRFEVFRRIESVVIGKKDIVDEELDKLEAGLDLFFKSLKVTYRKLRVTPWYANGVKQSESYTLDYQIKVDFNGKEKWVEVANLTRAGTKFTKSYGIRDLKNEYAVSGCSGVGLQRLVVVLVSYYGLEITEKLLQILA